MLYLNQRLKDLFYVIIAIPFFRFMFFIYSPRIQIIHYQRLKNLKGQGALIAPNHLSHLDPPLIGMMCRDPMAFLAKNELFKNKWLGSMIDWLGGIPLQREGIDRKSLEAGLRALKNKRNLCLFAEGTRGSGDILNSLNTGVAFLAKKSGAFVVPIAINGTQKILPKGAKRLQKSSIKVVVGEPFTYKDIQQRLGDVNEKTVKSEFMREFEKRMIDLGYEAGLGYASGILS